MIDPEQAVVSVFGANDAAEGSVAYETARAVGAQLARLGYAVANGGYGGAMEASARGAKACGGTTIGVTCTLWKSSPNQYMDRCVQTHSLAERLATLVELGSSGYVVLPGATGTLLELALVWERTAKGMTDRRPIVCVGEFWRPLLEMMAVARCDSGEHVALVERGEDLAAHFPPCTAGA